MNTNKPFEDQPSSKLSKESSVYHYTLIHRIRLPSRGLKYYLYSLLALVLYYILFDWTHVWYVFFCYGFVQLLHGVITYFFMKTNHISPHSWTVTKLIPWVGLIPKQYISLSRYRSLLFHHTLMGSVLIAFAIPWSSPSFYIGCLFIHIWILAPRFTLLRAFSKIDRHGYIKFEPFVVELYRS